MGDFGTLGLLAVTSLLVLLGRPVMAADAPPSPVFWHEAEDGAQRPIASGRSSPIGTLALAGRACRVPLSPKKGCTVTYELDIPQGLAHAQIIFRYARLHWRPIMTPATRCRRNHQRRRHGEGRGRIRGHQRLGLQTRGVATRRRQTRPDQGREMHPQTHRPKR